ncbi:carbohydrate ABC transporter permease [Dactylosporangium siamense]|uniref:ABC transporter permease n=2 Tax=Dactylosporangium siamense TaxID=685454 RepID=A0A919PIN2_9ACTN|nr:sugar ABC transporter permease [Dactylosporangium siamense]GIG42908.1 ABC transporter permease [Dactylosporangium siamense]
MAIETVAPPAARDSNPGPPPRRRNRNRPLWMLAPGGILLVLVILVPLGVALTVSLLDLDQYTLREWTGAPFIAFDNYVEAVTDTALPHAIWVSVGYSALVTVATLPVGLAAALATQQRFKGRALVRSAFLIPYVLPAFVVGTVWRTILMPAGPANSVLGEQHLWLNGPNSYWTLVVVQLWTSWPLLYLLAASGLQSISEEVHEAAALDGAAWWAKLRYVIFPHLRGVLALALIIAFLHNLNSFTLPYVLFGVPAPHDVEVLPVLTYVESFQNFRFGLSAAMAVLSLVLVAIPLSVYLRAVRLNQHEN